jgi:hypothetical protein
MTRPQGGRRVPFYGCLRYHKRGAVVCPNGLQIRQDVLDAEVLETLQKALDAELLADAVREAVGTLRASRGDVGARRVAIARELDVIAGREHRLLDALADGDITAGVIRDRLKTELSRRDALTAGRPGAEGDGAGRRGMRPARPADGAGAADDSHVARGAAGVRAIPDRGRARLHVHRAGNLSTIHP